MSKYASTLHNDLFSSLISDVKTYTGKDPLLPWLRESRSPQLLEEKLPRFLLQKCSQTFETDRRYTNDLRYIRVWLKLMDFVDDPGAIKDNGNKSHWDEEGTVVSGIYTLL